MLALEDMLSEQSTVRPLQPKTRIRSARSRNRAAAWSYDLAQWREYQFNRAPEGALSEVRSNAAGSSAGRRVDVIASNPELLEPSWRTSRISFSLAIQVIA